MPGSTSCAGSACSVLLNEHVVLQTRNVRGAQTDEEVLESALVLAGVTDYTAAHFDAAHASDPHGCAGRRAAAGAHPRAAAHQPRSALRLQPTRATSCSCRATRTAAQFFPWNLFVPMQQPFTAGLHRLHEMWVYMSRGHRLLGPAEALWRAF